MSDFTDQASSNGTKAAVHGAAILINGAMGVYNMIAWCKRCDDDGHRDRRLAVNAVVYMGLVIFECYQVARHCGH